MLGLDEYGSDGSDSESPFQQQQRPEPQSTTSSTSKKSTFSLPPPKKPLPKAKSKHPVFTVAKPSKDASSDGDEDRERPPKRLRLDARTGAGSSLLLAMLPAPSKTAPVRVAPPRVLGSASQGGNAGVIVPLPVDNFSSGDGFTEDNADVVDKSTLLVPPSLVKEKTQAAPLDKETKSASSEPTVDFFSLGINPSAMCHGFVHFTKSLLGTSSSRVTQNPSTSQADDQGPSSITITSAPTLPTFEPPMPTSSDPYPGYYQLPSGQWAAHDPEFYRKYYEMWSGNVALDGTSQKGFEGAEGDETVEVDAQEQLDIARKEREEKKALTKDAIGGRAAPKMNIKASSKPSFLCIILCLCLSIILFQAPKIGSRARTRHQLSALLTEAYENREALEEKIAQGRRNRKEAGNKYGF